MPLNFINFKFINVEKIGTVGKCQVSVGSFVNFPSFSCKMFVSWEARKL